MKQTTLKESFQVSGKGLHTGLQIKAELLPAPKITVISFNVSTSKVNPKSMPWLKTWWQPRAAR